MKKVTKYPLLVICLFLFMACNETTSKAQKDSTNKLWYNKPANVWMESLPQGNGRLGITTFGGIENETISLNEITMWSGQYDENMHRPAGKKVLDEIRQTFFDGDYIKGNGMATDHLAGNSNSFGSHVPLGDMKLQFKYQEGEVTDYKRELDLHTALSTVEFKKGGVKYNREYICTNPDDVFIVKLSADKVKSISFDLTFDLQRESTFVTKENGLEFGGKVSFRGPGGVDFQAKVALKTIDGELETTDSKVSVKDASEVILVFDCRTNYSNDEYKENCFSSVGNALNKDFEVIKKNHIADYSNLYSRVDLFLGDCEMYNLPTDERWRKVKEGNTDVGLDALFFNYARYLLIAASRENSPLPANLQGVWNDNLACNMGWANDYHLDINTQQNYWLSNTANLHELNAPLFRYIQHLAEYGSKTANDVYGARGWTAHTIANVWGYTACGGGINWGLFPLASSWIASHLWTQYEYTLDEDFLRNEAYPLLKSNAEFLLDFMVEDPKTGHLVTGPCTSPENAFLYDGWHLSVSMMPTSDRVLAYEILNYCSKASKILGIDEEFRNQVDIAISKLPPMMIGKNGGIQEWYVDFDEASPNHRHTTHLLSLYPFSQITPTKTPELANAARKTIELRLAAEGWEDVEWSRANMICMYARLLDAEKAYESVVQMEREFVRENLLTISPEGIAGAPYDIFIFDGNEAAASGIAEMLLQCYDGCMEFIPALPKVWKDGYIKGFSVRGGANVDLDWKDSKMKTAKIVATIDNSFTIKLGDSKPIVKIDNKKVDFVKEGGQAQFSLKKGQALEFYY